MNSIIEKINKNGFLNTITGFNRRNIYIHMVGRVVNPMYFNNGYWNFQLIVEKMVILCCTRFVSDSYLEEGDFVEVCGIIDTDWLKGCYSNCSLSIVSIYDLKIVSYGSRRFTEVIVFYPICFNNSVLKTICTYEDKYDGLPIGVRPINTQMSYVMYDEEIAKNNTYNIKYVIGTLVKNQNEIILEIDALY